MQALPISRFLTLVTLVALTLLPGGSFNALADTSTSAAIDAVLDDFHEAAAEADEQRYLGHFATDGVFMGTDDWERWPLPAFTQYVHERFATGAGWSYVPEERSVTIGPHGDSAWFDEIVVSARWGRFRGTGVMLNEGGAWKIAHYSLTALVPNERFADVARVTIEGFRTRAAKDHQQDD